MNDSIEFRGVKTNNLKNIDVVIKKNKITAIYGRSGAGKSSLAFSTVYQLCKDEFEALENGNFDASNYILDSYSNIIPSVAITQTNINNNPHSTLYSYLNISQLISLVPQKHSNIPNYTFLKLNRPDNICPTCNGLGVVNEVSLDDLIDDHLSIIENPFRCWKVTSQNDYYYKLILEFSKNKGIPLDVPYKELNKNHVELLLNGDKEVRLSFRARYNGKIKDRRDYYSGILQYANENLSLKSMNGLYKILICPNCKGSRINTERYKNIRLFNLTFQQFLTSPFDEIVFLLATLDYTGDLLDILKSISEMGLGYLSFARSIPSLSGGELQKIKFSRLLNSNISGVLIVIDEISSQLNEVDYPLILTKLRELAKDKTIILVEHESFFINSSDEKIHIGREAGEKGGFLSEPEVIQEKNIPIRLHKSNDFFVYEKMNKHNVINQTIKIPKKCITVITGVSGSGKSTIAKIIEERSKAIYITQKSSSYGNRSNLAVSIKVNDEIAKFYSAYTGFPVENFLPNKEGGCKSCSGTGVVNYDRGFDGNICQTCPTCEGKLFDKENPAVNKSVKGLNIIEVYQRELGELIGFFDNPYIDRIFDTMIGLGLSYLYLARKTQTLSGGEQRRIKLCENFSRARESKKILIVDEPTAGLDPETASIVMAYIRSKLDLFSAMIIIEHDLNLLKYCDYQVRIGEFAGKDGGKVLSEVWTFD